MNILIVGCGRTGRRLVPALRARGHQVAVLDRDAQTLEELVQKIETGHSISPGIMGGMSAKDWKEQQLFMVDIDNEDDWKIAELKYKLLKERM